MLPYVLIHPEAKQVCRETKKMVDELANKFFDKFYERQHEKFVEEGWVGDFLGR